MGEQLLECWTLCIGTGISVIDIFPVGHVQEIRIQGKVVFDQQALAFDTVAFFFFAGMGVRPREAEIRRKDGILHHVYLFLSSQELNGQDPACGCVVS